MPTPVGDQPTRDDAGSRDLPGGRRRARDGAPSGAEPVTVEQVLARQGGGVGRRRAARREQPAADVRPERSSAVRTGLPPVPGADPQPVTRAGLPPVPSALPRHPSEPLPPNAFGTGSSPGPELPEARPVRRSGPIPPLPHRTAPAGERPRRRPSRADRPPASPGRRRLVRTITAVALVLGLVVLYHLGLYFYVDQKITRVPALATDGPEILAPQLQADEQNYLVVGTGVPGQVGPASVAALLASVSPKGDRAVLVSVPPTALVDTPLCRDARGRLRDPVTEAFAASLMEGGPSCMVRAVQELSGLRIDHYLGVDLRRLPGMVDALGGVPICTVPSPAIQAAATPPPPGPARLSGAAASGFLRPGDPRTDVTGAAVAERAQRLLTSTLRAAMSTSTLADPPRLARFLSRAADALTVDEQTTLGDLRALAGSLGGLTGDAVERAGLPVDKVGYRPAGSRASYVLLDPVATRSVFDSVIGRTRIPADVLAGSAAGGEAGDGRLPARKAAPATPPAAATPAVPTAAVTLPPASVTVDVLNGTGTTGLAGTVADQLRAQGFGVGTVGNETGSVTSSVVRFGPSAAAKARTVVAAVPGAVLQPDASLGDAVQLVIGPGFSAVVPVRVAPPAVAAATTSAAAATTSAAAPSTAATPVTCG